ncbi:MAG: hypothetical protein WC974_07800 [Thermoplasmata archaeon]
MSEPHGVYYKIHWWNLVRSYEVCSGKLRRSAGVYPTPLGGVRLKPSSHAIYKIPIGILYDRTDFARAKSVDGALAHGSL